MRKTLALFAVGLWAVGVPGVSAQETGVEETPIVTPLNQRFSVVVLDQPDRDLLRASPRINMMFDTRTGRSWILEYARKPNSNEQGYVWVEVPLASPPAKNFP